MGLDGIGGFGKDYAAEFRKNTQAGMDDIRAKVNELTGNVPVGQPETKELGRDFLNDPYASLGLNITRRPEAGSLEDLVLQTDINVSNVDRVAKKEAFNAVSDPLTQAYMYGPLDEGTSNTLASLGDSLDVLGDPNYKFYVPADVA